MNIFNKGQQQYSGFSTSLKSGKNESATGNAGNDGEKSKFNLDEPIVTNAGTKSSDLVDLKGAQRSLIMADDNRDGVVDQRELANASYQLLSNEDATPEEQGVGQLFGTMVVGGESGKGLFPDIDQNGGITESDLTMLARGDDDAETLSSTDFKAAFGDEVKDGGNAISLSELEKTASGEGPVYYGVGAEEETETGEPGDDEKVTGDKDEKVTGDEDEKVNGDKEKPVNGDKEKPVNGDKEKPVNGDKEKPVNGDKEKPVNGDKEKPVNGDKEKPVNGDKEKPVNGDKEKPVNGDKEKPVNGDKDEKVKGEPKKGAGNKNENASSDGEMMGYLATIFTSLGEIFGSFSEPAPKKAAGDKAENAGASGRSPASKDAGGAYGAKKANDAENAGSASKPGNAKNQGASDKEKPGADSSADSPMAAMMTIFTSILTMLMSLFGGGQQKA